MSDGPEVPFTYVRLKTLVDGGMRIEVDVAEINQPTAFALFKTGSDGIITRKKKDGGAASGPRDNGDVNLGKACEDPRPDKTKRRMNPTEIRAIDLCRNGVFLNYLYSIGVSDTEEGARDYVNSKCGTEHRYQIEKSREAAVAFGKIEAEFEAWQKKTASW